MRKTLLLLGIFALILPLVFLGCDGDDGAQGPQGIQGPIGPEGPEGPAGPGAPVAFNLESCAVCHDDDTVRDGDAHQADYDQRFQDNVLVVTGLSYNYVVGATDNTHVTTFSMTMDGQPFNCTELVTSAGRDALSIYFQEYNAATRSFNPPAPFPSNQRLSLGTAGSRTAASTLTYNPTGNLCTSTVFDNNANGPVGDVRLRPAGLIVMIGRHDTQGTLPSPSRVVLSLHPFAALLETGAGVNYVSGANVAGCEKCHTVPFLKHGYEYGQVNHDPATDFYVCKGCHSDNGPGGHFIWQLLVDDPRLIITLENQYGSDWEEEAFFKAADPRITPYAYRTRLMNDVHMSHAMEFAYPQSMSNCATCHEEKLDAILTDNNFVIETCKSCHPVTDASYADGKNYSDPLRAPALDNIWRNAGVASFHNTSLTCNSGVSCHISGSPAGAFNQLHTGYDKEIYTDNGVKYSSAIKVTIDNNASFDRATNVLSWGFSATGTLGGLSSTNIAPTVLVGLYGYGTKDYIVGPHETNADGRRNLEAAATETHPRITITSPAAGSWNVQANLSQWADLIAADNVTKVEVAVMPRLRNPALRPLQQTSDNTVALDAPSRTFSLTDNAFVANYFQGTQAIVRVEDGAVGGYVSGCNNCHDALGTTFHSADRGGNIVVCRLCHITKNAGSHLELQSRSIDSYAHAIHRFQVFDIGDIDFDDPVEVMEFEHHVQSNFPTFGVENCRACHNAAKFNVPDQSKSLPGLLSPTDTGVPRDISDLPSFITGPAIRACGACHRAEAIIANAGEGDPVKLANINSHMSTFGYMIETITVLPTDNLAVSRAKQAQQQADLLRVIFEIFGLLQGEGGVDIGG